VSAAFPAILNALYNKTQFWDGRVNTLEEQAALPIVNPLEMGQPGMDAAVASRRLGNISRPSGPSSVARPMDPTWCARSHPTNERRRLMILLSIASFINSGNTEAIDRAAIETDMSALGRFFVTKKKADIAAFKTPDVRNVLVTGPYFHDGSQETLWDVVDHYNKGADPHNPYLDQDIQPLALTEQDINDLVAFLVSLTSADYREQGVEELARQRELSRTKRPQRDTARAFGPKPPRPDPPSP
jgi:cytochrome c peroxidase